MFWILIQLDLVPRARVVLGSRGATRKARGVGSSDGFWAVGLDTSSYCSQGRALGSGLGTADKGRGGLVPRTKVAVPNEDEEDGYPDLMMSEAI